MADIFVYYTDLPQHVHEMVTSCCDGYTVYIDKNLSEEMRIDAFLHAVGHIYRNDFEKVDVSTIEQDAHVLKL